MMLNKLHILNIILLTLISPSIYATNSYADSLLKALNDSQSEDKARINNEISDHYLHNQNFEEAKKYANKAYDISKETKKIDQEIKAKNNLASISISSGHYGDGKKHALEALELARKHKNTNAEAMANNLLGNVSYYTSEYDDALKYWTSSLKIREAQENKEEAAILIMNIGIIYKNKGEYKKAIENNEKALKIHQEIGNSDMIGRILGNIGNIYFYSELDYNKALDYYKESLEYFIKEEFWQGEANIYNSIGLVYEKQDSIDIALQYFNKSYKIYNEKNYAIGKAQSLSSIGSIQLKKNNLDVALEHFYKCLEIFENQESQREIALTQSDIGKIFFLKKNYRRALRYKLTALKIMKEMDSKKEVSDMCKEISDMYFEINDINNAYKYYKLYSTLKDSLFTSEYSDMVSEWQTKYDTEKKEQELIIQKTMNQQQEEKIKRKNVTIYFFVFGIAMFVVFSVLLIKQINQKKKANDKIEKQNKQITGSIQYASRIQNAVLPSSDQLHKILEEHFILFRPKDIVSGDFYWMTVDGNKSVLVAADCTGHGVPGAFMSMLGISFLNEIVKVKKIYTANEILNELRKMVKSTLAQSGENVANDGMDISLVVIDKDSMQIEFAGAYNHLYIIKNGELSKIKADRMPIGNYVKEKDSFTNNVLEIEKGDVFYIFSDGYADQFGGEKNEKYTVKALQQIFIEIHKMPMHVQQKTLFNNFIQWKGDQKQIDDVLVIGAKV